MLMICMKKKIILFLLPTLIAVVISKTTIFRVRNESVYRFAFINA